MLFLIEFYIIISVKQAVERIVYEATYYPEQIENSGKASYVERNQEMINKSKYCVIYYDENYMSPRRRNSRRDLFDCQPKSGTKVAYDYAVRKKREIINLFD